MNILFKYLNTVGAFLSSISIIGFFVQALISPELNINWIYTNAVIIFIIEFLSIHSTAMMIGEAHSKDKKKNATHLFFLYLFFTIVLTVIFKNYILPFFFILSTYIKFFMGRYIADSKTYLLISILTFIIPLIIVIIGANLLEYLFPFPQEVLMARPVDAKGLFYDVPQTVLVWGVLYFSIEFIINLYLQIKTCVQKQS